MPHLIVQILENKQIAADIFAMTIPWKTEAKPGQFCMLRPADFAVWLPRAISVCDLQNGRMTFLYAKVGVGTAQMSRMKAGDVISVTGPLGNGFPLDEITGKVALVAGGIGIAPMLYTARRLRERGITADCLAGFRDEPYFPPEFQEQAANLHIATESGRAGHKGFVTGILRPEEYSAVLCCGPLPMMKAVTGQCKAAGTPVYVSMENKMACGVGACLVCTCADTEGKNRRACKDGPVFRGECLNFDA